MCLELVQHTPSRKRRQPNQCMNTIDFRSDTVTKPTPRMRAAMAEAEVGDDVVGEDPTINKLEEMAADLLGKQAAILATSGTQSNLLGLLGHCERGEEYIVGQTAHTYRYEGGGAAVLGSIQPQPLDFEADGSLALDKVEAAIKADDFHFARTRLLCLENTQGGKVLPLDYLTKARGLADRTGLSLHLDGARAFNAAVASGVTIDRIAEPFDSVSICLSKGLGAPVGSVLCGPGALIDKARRWRKMLGGGMRQGGIIAAAGVIALSEHVDRLAEDHAHAKLFAEGLAGIEELHFDADEVQTNMLFLTLPTGTQAAFHDYVARHGIIISDGNPVRLVTHLDISSADIERAIDVFKSFFAGH